MRCCSEPLAMPTLTPARSARERSTPERPLSWTHGSRRWPGLECHRLQSLGAPVGHGLSTPTPKPRQSISKTPISATPGLLPSTPRRNTFALCSCSYVCLPVCCDCGFCPHLRCLCHLVGSLMCSSHSSVAHTVVDAFGHFKGKGVNSIVSCLKQTHTQTHTHIPMQIGGGGGGGIRARVSYPCNNCKIKKTAR